MSLSLAFAHLFSAEDAFHLRSQATNIDSHIDFHIGPPSQFASSNCARAMIEVILSHFPSLKFAASVLSRLACSDTFVELFRQRSMQRFL